MMDSLINQRFRLSAKLYSSGHFQQALSELQSINSWADSLQGYWSILAFCYQKLGQKDRSKVAFLRAIESDKLNSELYAQFANLLADIKDFAAAESNYKIAISLNSANHVFHYNLGLFYFNQGLYLKAIESLKRANDISPGHENSFYLRVQAQALAGDHELYLEAHRTLFQFLKTNTLNRRCLKLWADMLWLKKDSDWSLFYTNLCNAGQINLDVLGDFISKLINANQVSQAEEILSVVSILQPELNLNFLHAYVAYSAGRYSEALDFMHNLPGQYHDADIFQRLMIYIRLSLLQPNDALPVSIALTEKTTTPLQEDIALLATSYKHSGNWSAYREIYNYDAMVRCYPVQLPAGFRTMDDFNNTLVQYIYELHQSKNHPIEQSLRNGSQTSGHLFNLNSALIGQLKDAISLCVKEFISSMPQDLQSYFFRRKKDNFRYTGSWSVKLSDKGFHRNHFHNDGWISGCYYIQVPHAVEQQGQGWIKFGEMETVSNQQNDADLYVKPIAGHVVLFPSYMWHGTVPFESEQTRLTVAFDLIPE
jgi:uncharacterized protein (TIGR02466 family)